MEALQFPGLHWYTFKNLSPSSFSLPPIFASLFHQNFPDCVLRTSYPHLSILPSMGVVTTRRSPWPPCRVFPPVCPSASLCPALRKPRMNTSIQRSSVFYHLLSRSSLLCLLFLSAHCALTRKYTLIFFLTKVSLSFHSKTFLHFLLNFYMLFLITTVT